MDEEVVLRKPVIRQLLLEAVHDLLLEHAVVVADAIAPGGIVQLGNS
jgi:hypothetical protein